MKRQIFIVNAEVVDANGTFNTLNGYPKTFDSKNYGDDIEKTRLRAEGEYSETYGAFCKRDDRQLQTVMIYTADGFLIDHKHIGKIADLPDPEPEPNETTE